MASTAVLLTPSSCDCEFYHERRCHGIAAGPSEWVSAGLPTTAPAIGDVVAISNGDELFRVRVMTIEPGYSGLITAVVEDDLLFAGRYDRGSLVQLEGRHVRPAAHALI